MIKLKLMQGGRNTFDGALEAQKTVSQQSKIIRRMKHKYKETDDPSLNQFFMNLMAFQEMSPNLLKSRNMNDFMHWFEKLYNTDRRSLLMFIYKYRNVLNGDYIIFAEKVFGRRINE